MRERRRGWERVYDNEVFTPASEGYSPMRDGHGSGANVSRRHADEIFTKASVGVCHPRLGAIDLHVVGRPAPRGDLPDQGCDSSERTDPSNHRSRQVRHSKRDGHSRNLVVACDTSSSLASGLSATTIALLLPLGQFRLIVSGHAIFVGLP